jgi:NAD(P)-dependent dehydrogenase (short-subunit alcohol dehydrogenase family)
MKSTATTLVIPGWGMDWAGYQTACRYLGLHPDPELHAQLSRYLLHAASSQPAPSGFPHWLAERQAGRVRLGFLDLWTRWLLPAHPWRFRLNAILAIHECDPRGCREMLTQPASRLGAWLSLIGIGATALWNLLAGGVWLAGTACAYTLFGGAQRREQARFNGKTVLITGAARGLGLALALRLLALGAQVVGVARNSAGRDALCRQLADAGLQTRFRLVTADVAQPGALAAALTDNAMQTAHIDTAIINAGIKENAALPAPPGALQRVFDVNVFGAMDSAAALIPAMRARGDGQLVFISSLGRWHGMGQSGAYNASKAALHLLVESLAMDLGEAGRRAVRITSVEPGLIRTGMIVPGSLQDRLAVSAEQAAQRILRAAAANRRVCRFPLLFTLLTLTLAHLPQGLRIRLLGRVKR